MNPLADDRAALAAALADITVAGETAKVYPYWPDSFLNPPFILIDPDDPAGETGQGVRQITTRWRITLVLSGINEGNADRQIEQMIWDTICAASAAGYPIQTVGKAGTFAEGTQTKLIAAQIRVTSRVSIPR